MRNKLIIIGLVGLAFSATRANAQETIPADTAAIAPLDDSLLTVMHCNELASSYGVDAILVENTSALDKWISDLKGTFPECANQCTDIAASMGKMLASLKSDFETRDGKLWMDSTTCIVDAESFMASLTAAISKLQNSATTFESKEQARLAAEKAAAEAQARAEEAKRQQDMDNLLAVLKDSITDLHRQITIICDGNGISDKSRLKELKDIHYAYLSIYNKQDLALGNADMASIERFGTILEFQKVLVDSVLGEHSYANRIESFKEELRVRCGKDYTDVNKSYQKVFKKTQVPVVFSSLIEFEAYVQKLKDILTVQRSYITTIDRREVINANTNDILARCGKNHKEIASSYKEVVSLLPVTPTQTNLIESDAFIARLDEFIQVQQEYVKVIAQIDGINSRSENIFASCGKPLSDVSAAYKTLVSSTIFVPNFSEMSGADFFTRKMNDFEQMQDIYIEVVRLRLAINAKNDSIESHKSTAKELVAGYNVLKGRVNFVPAFANSDKGHIFTEMLEDFLKIQDKVLSTIRTKDLIAQNTKTIKSNKDCSNMVKAYDIVMKSFETETTILNEGDFDKYIRHQEVVLAAQTKFLDVINNGNKKEYDKRLKKEKDLNRIKLIMEID